MRMRIDGTEYEAPPGATVLDVALEHGLQTIPTLCHTRTLPDVGACRLCVVDVGSEPPVLAAACTLPVAEGLSVRTDTPAVRSSRELTLSYLLLRDSSPATLSLAGRVAPHLLGPCAPAAAAEPGCLLCGICVRTCEAIGIGAIAFVGRGRDRRVARGEDPATSGCIGCGACERVCPSGYLSADSWQSGTAVSSPVRRERHA